MQNLCKLSSDSFCKKDGQDTKTFCKVTIRSITCGLMIKSISQTYLNFCDESNDSNYIMIR
jgi:hypothetical protein